MAPRSGNAMKLCVQQLNGLKLPQGFACSSLTSCSLCSSTCHKGQSNMWNLLKSRIAFNIVQPSFSVQGPCFHFHVKPACAFTSLAIAPEESRRQFSSVLMKSPMFSCTYRIYQSTPWPLGVPRYTAMAYPHLGSSPLHTNHVCWLGSIGLLILWTYPISQFLYYIMMCYDRTSTSWAWRNVASFSEPAACDS